MLGPVTSRDFCFWLQGFMELQQASQCEPRPHDAPEPSSPRLNAAQTECVKRHLALVFKHEIDPSMGGKVHQDELDKTHAPPKPVPHWQLPQDPGGPLMRC